VKGAYEHGNEPLCYIKGWIFRDKLSDCQLLKKASVRWS
jgi:hypothetical protein